MTMIKWAYISFGMMWVATAFAVSVGIYVSGNWKCLFFMLLPAMFNVKSHSGDKNGDK